MKTGFALAAVAAACLSTIAAAQMGPGMMGGPGMSGGPGMGQGMGQGMVGGPGRMGGQGMGPGMTGGRGGCEMGPGMTHGKGMGAGMMGGPVMAGVEALNLTDEQRGKVTEIRREVQRKNHALMGSMHELKWQAEDAAKTAEFDEAAARKRFDAMAAIHKQMFETRLDARKRIDSVLTKEQREQLRKTMTPGAAQYPSRPSRHD
ncbi:MAG: Spy/CpxP family protein refolding chaperone [Betaproteobacteria bacterium]|nr:Spy/CpxP family protein refolding chaperone [Betaproteobacteria bacterium]